MDDAERAMIATAALPGGAETASAVSHHSPILGSRLGYENALHDNQSPVLVCADDHERQFLMQ